MNFVLRWLGVAVATAVAIWLMPGLHTVGDSGYIAVAVFSLALSLVNSLIKPFVKTLSFPLTLLTLGIFYLIINGAMLMLASWLSVNMFASGVVADTFGDAVVGSIVISIVSALVNSATGAENN